jgi:hypothetical protein
MCKLKSAIILKDRVFIPDYDSHTQMLEELGIEDTLDNAERLFVRAELSPRDGDVFSPVDEWGFTVDQDIRPDWFVEEYEKQRMVDAVKAWAKDRIHVGVNGLCIGTGSNHYIKDCTVECIYDNATVECIYGNATVIGSPSGWKNKDKVILSQNATFKDRESKIIYQAGDWELRLVDQSK